MTANQKMGGSNPAQRGSAPFSTQGVEIAAVFVLVVVHRGGLLCAAAVAERESGEGACGPSVPHTP